MATDDRDPIRRPTLSSHFRSRQRGIAIPFVVVTLSVALAATALPVLLVSRGQEPPQNPTGATGQNQFQLGSSPFYQWPKPDVAIMISGQMNGYLQPCGCSEPQWGGLARRFNFLQSMRDKGWNVASADIGDIPQASGPEAQLKYKYAMTALKKMDYTAASFGKNEMGLGLVTTLGEFAFNEKKPRIIASNLKDRNGPLFAEMVGAGIVSAGQGASVGFIAIIDGEPNDPDVKLEKSLSTAIADGLKELKSKPDLLVLLFQGKLDAAKAIASHPKLPKFDVIAIPIEEEDPSNHPTIVGNTMIVSAGQKGRHVSVVGAFRTTSPAKPYELRYQLVPIGPEYETPKGLDRTNPIHALLQEYAQRVKNNNLLAEFTKNPSKHQVQVELAKIGFPGSKYVGSEKCKQCHESAYTVLQNSKHFHAYQTLETKAVRPTLRQYDGECVRCHVTGFTYETGFVSETETPKLKSVGCEACHGPASQHTLNPNNEAIRKIINPWKYKPSLATLSGAAAQEKKMTIIHDNACKTCHDQDNSPHFQVDAYWKMIAHPTPPPNGG